MNKGEFNALYRAHYQQVLGHCRRMLGSAQDAEDAAQEVFVKAFRGIRRYKREQAFGPWVAAICSNHCIDLLRRRKRLRETFREDDETQEAADPQAEEGEASLINEYQAEAIQQAVEALPEKYRLPIVLAYYSEASYEEIARQLGISRNHVGVLLLRGKQQLRRALAGEINEQHSREEN